MKTSKFLSLNTFDLIKAFAMAVLTPAMLIIQQSLDAGMLTFNWKAIVTASLAGGFAYLTKNLFSGNKIE